MYGYDRFLSETCDVNFTHLLSNKTYILKEFKDLKDSETCLKILKF